MNVIIASKRMLVCMVLSVSIFSAAAINAQSGTISYTAKDRVAQSISGNINQTFTGDFSWTNKSITSTGINGGAISLESISGDAISTFVGNFKFDTNKASGGGGGAVASYALKGISSIKFSSNEDDSYTEFIFQKNASRYGGAINSTGGHSFVELSANVGSISFIDNNTNHGTGSGGGIYSIASTIVPVTFNDGASKVNLSVGTGSILFSGNTTTISGAGIFSSVNNVATVPQGSSKIKLSVGDGSISFINNAAANNGGAIYSYVSGEYGISTVDVSMGEGSVSFTNNSATNTSAINRYGGAIFSRVTGASGISLVNLSVGNDSSLQFENNIVDTSGGGIYSDAYTSKISLSAGDNSEIVFRGNKNNGIANAMYISGMDLGLDINVGEAGIATFYDPITTLKNDSRLQVNLNDPASKATEQSGLIVFDGQDYVDADDANRYYDILNDTTLHNGALALANNVIYGRAGLSDAQMNTMQINDGASLFSINNFNRNDINNILNADVTLNGSLAFMNEMPDKYHKLTLNSLSGGGDIYMNLDLDTGAMDELSVVNNVNGHYILKPAVVAGDGDLAIIPILINSGVDIADPDTFSGQMKFRGFYKYDVIAKEVDVNSYNWEWVRSGSELADVTIGSIASMPLMWFTQLDNLHNRLRVADYNGFEKLGDAIWGRAFGNTISADFDTPNNIKFTENHYGSDVGMDLIAKNGNTKVLAGVFGGYMRSDRDFGNDIGNGNSLSPYGGIYGSLTDNNGFYMDITAKVQGFTTKFSGVDDSGSFKNLAIGASLNIGKSFGFGNGFFVEPRLKADYLHLNSNNFILDINDIKLSVEDSNIYRLLGGFRLGQKVGVGSNNNPLIWYVSADIENQSSTAGLIRAEYDTIYDNNADGMQTVFGLGLSYNDSASSKIYLDAKSSIGDKYRQKLGLSLGYSLRF